MRFLSGKPEFDLTYDDVFMAPRRSSVTSRLDVDMTSTDGLNLPLRRPFIFGCVAGAIGGAIVGFSNTHVYSFGFANIFTLGG